MNENFILELSTSLEEQVTSYQHACSQIFSRNEFVDCTLCCSDGQLQAHRVILASVSNYMHTMLSTTPWPTPCSHPMLFFKTFSMSDMKLALEFIYTGKSKVSKNKLPTLMNIARELGCGSLSKAIEKAIHSCGVEIFRKRIQLQTQTSQLTSQPVSTSTTYAYSPFQNKILVPNQTQSTVNNRFSQQKSKEVNNDPYLLTLSPNKNQENVVHDDESFCVRNDIKLEPEENMMLELDPSSIVTTMESASITNNTNQASSFSDANNDILTTQEEDVDIKADNNMEATDKSRHVQGGIDDLIGMKNKLQGSEIDDEIPNVNMIDNAVHEVEDVDDDDDEQVHDEEDEEMPITVVDLKSLAETGPEAETDAIVMSSTGIENSETLPANCPWCFQIFTSLTLLQRHIKTHVGKYKPYSCQYCPASFARTAHLKRHIRTHTGEKPFICTFCSRAFSRQDKLKTHLEKHLLDQHLQNASAAATLTSSTGFSSFNQSNVSLARPNNAIKTSSSVASTTASSGLIPQKQIAHGISNSTSFNQCLPSSAYQYFINEGPETWQTQGDRISKGILGAPGQITISTTISPSTTITPVSSLLAHTNAPPPHL